MSLFGTDGVRGVAGEAPIDASGARRIGAAAARWSKQVGDGRVLIGRDTRPTGAELSSAVAQGVVAAGGVALDAGVVPTPALQAAVGPSVGVMVTASHNPARDNGFKVLGPGGRKPGDDEAAHLEALMAEPPAGCGGPVHGIDLGTAWAQGLASLGGLAGRSVAVDLAGGAASAWREQIGTALGASKVVWVDRPEATINDGVGSEHPAALAEAVRQHGLDAGIAVDGDGDRALLVDERGEVVPGDALLGLLAAQARAEVLVVTVMSSTALEAALPAVRVVRTPVGDRHVAAALVAEGAPVGGEESGHVIFADGPPGGDGLRTAILALQAAWAREATLSAAWAPFRPWPRRLTKVRSASRGPLDAVAAVVRAAEADLVGGRVFLRWSGTEPVLRVLVEGPEADAVDRWSRELTEAYARALA